MLSTPRHQGYQWLKDKILSEEGRRQQAKLKELQAIAERLGCTLPQLAIGTRTWGVGLTVVPRAMSGVPEGRGCSLHQPGRGNGAPTFMGREAWGVIPEHGGYLSPLEAAGARALPEACPAPSRAKPLPNMLDPPRHTQRRDQEAGSLWPRQG